MQNIKIDWDKMVGLVPAIVQDYESGEVLMLAYMNKQAFNLTLNTGFAHYYSRSKDRIWKKGQESGNTQKIIEIKLDCDNDSLLLKVKQKGGACHTGAKSCFFKVADKDGFKQESIKFDKPNYNILDEIYHTILDKKLNGDKNSSYTASLFAKGENQILKKISEEALEFCLACKDLTKFKLYGDFNLEKFGEHNENPKYDVIYEASDLIFHTLIALANHNISPEQIFDELKRRCGISGLTEKANRKEKN